MKNKPPKHRTEFELVVTIVDELLTYKTLTRRQRKSITLAAKHLRPLTQPERGRRRATYGTHLTPQDVALRFHVTPVTVRSWAAKGILKSISTPGGHRRFPVDVVERLASKRGF